MQGLRYTGDATAGQWIGGHPASDHNEPDDALAAAKAASGLYAIVEPFPEPERVAPATAEPVAPVEPRPLDWWRPSPPAETAPAVSEDRAPEPLAGAADPEPPQPVRRDRAVRPSVSLPEEVPPSPPTE